MALIGNYNSYSKLLGRCLTGGTTTNTQTWNIKPALVNSGVLRSRDIYWPAYTSVSDGYSPGDALYIARSATILALASQTVIAGVGTFTPVGLKVKLSSATIDGIGIFTNSFLSVLLPATSTLAGTSSISNALMSGGSAIVGSSSGIGIISDAALSAIVASQTKLLSATLTGTGAFTSNIVGFAYCICTIAIGDPPGITADDIWTYNISSITTAGLAGKKLNDASSAGNPWSALLTDNTTSGTFGAFVQKLLTVAKFLGLK